MKNNKLKLAVAGAVLAFGQVASAGIIIPAGDWTVDLSGNMNTFYSNTDFTGAFSTQKLSGGSVATGSILTVVTSFNGAAGVMSAVATDAAGSAATTQSLVARGGGQPITTNANQISTGLLPSAIGIGAKTRQNDLDVAIQTTFFVGANSSSAGSGAYGSTAGAGNNSLNIRQAYLSFGDKSWGTIKMGRDLGTFGSDAILSDMTLLGVGTGAGGAGNSTLGRIGSGYLYADWVGQIQYQSPNFSGFQLQGAIREPWANSSNARLGYEGKATFDFNANDVSGRIWVGGIHQELQTADTAAVAASNTTVRTFANATSYTDVTTKNLAVAAASGVKKDARAFDVGGKIKIGGFGLVGYYYDGQNIGSAGVAGNTPLSGLFLGDAASGNRDVKGGYGQATFKLPVGTTLGASYGVSKVGTTSADTTAYGAANVAEYENKSYILGAYHPVTKHLNLVGEYTNTEYENVSNFRGYDGKAKTFALGAILFF